MLCKTDCSKATKHPISHPSDEENGKSMILKLKTKQAIATKQKSLR